MYCKRCPQLCQLSCPAPANKHTANEGWGDTRMPRHTPMPAPGSHHSSHLPQHICLLVPRAWQGPMYMGQSPTPASPGGTVIFLTEPPDRTLVMLQGGGTQVGPHCGPTLGQFSNASPVSAASWVTHGPEGSSPMQHHSAQPQSGLLSPKASAEGTQRTVMFPKVMGRAWGS